jgi:hypothetical protein
VAPNAPNFTEIGEDQDEKNALIQNDDARSVLFRDTGR